ncbi:MAG: HDOD domain-containing protein [Gammaproteobacteria bacterium]|nr:HDOD domain-containing protein [Gammaproteobacteria bacterium]
MREEIFNRLNKVKYLSTVSTSLIGQLADIHSFDIEVEELAELVEKDPAVLARIVGVANSASFSPKTPVYTAKDAIFNVLGVRTAKALAIAILIGGNFNTKLCPSFSAQQFWHRSLLAGFIAQNLAEKSTIDDIRTQPERAYLIGVLHGLGILAMVDIKSDAMATIFNKSGNNVFQLMSLSSEMLGVTPAEVGEYIAERWGLTDDIISALAHYHERDYRGMNWELSFLLQMSIDIATSLIDGETDIKGMSQRLSAIGISQHDGVAVIEKAMASYENISIMADVLSMD